MFLGSGASVASGIPTLRELVLNFKREILITQSKINAHKYKDLKIETVTKEIEKHFDDLIKKAINTLNYKSCQVISPDTATSVNKFRKDISTVVKLHGDFRYDSLQNTDNELQKRIWSA